MCKNTIFLLCALFFFLFSCADRQDTEAKATFVAIAHGGGAINNDVYTDSLEALDNSYKLGCKYFELDMQETSDYQLVAVHDWKEFKEMINYQENADGTPLHSDVVKK